MTNELRFFDPETRGRLYRVPEGAMIPKNTPYGYTTQSGAFNWRTMGCTMDIEIVRGSAPHFTREPIAPPLPTEPGAMIRNAESDLHALLDSLTDGEHVKTTWVYDKCTVTVEGPVHTNGRIVQCHRYIRGDDGSIVSHVLTSFEVIRYEEATVTRDDEATLHELIDSLEAGQEVTAEWRSEKGSMTLTGTVRTSGPRREVHGCGYSVLRRHTGVLHDLLRSVTVRRHVVQRWERENNE